MKNSEQPASTTVIPVSVNSPGIYNPGLTKLEQTCIQLGIPKTGDADFDAIILEANRRDLAAKAMNGLLVNYVANGQYGSHTEYPMVHKIAVRCADALLAELATH
jgi:hypothetical protein